jgi:DNA-binding NarL/FixJ family response regulator
MFKLLIVEDNPALRAALGEGFTTLGDVDVIGSTASGEEALENCLAGPPQVILMDVQLAGKLNGIQAAVAIRREFPRLPVVFYSIQDDDAYYRDFQHSGILSHYAYVRKSNYLLPVQLVPLMQNAMAGRSFIDPEIEQRVLEVRHKDEQSPMACLEPNEQAVAQLICQGFTNEQIAERLGFRDKRTISRTNGQIYAAWGLDASTTDEKVARTRAALIVLSGRMLEWNDAGQPYYRNERGELLPWSGHER